MASTELCEWDPARERPALDDPRQGCLNEATVCVGRDGLWHLCESCADLPYFKRYKRREALRKAP